MRALELQGKRFGRWTVIERVKSTPQGVLWSCICDCGNKGTVNARWLADGQSQSCGCLHRERTSESNRTHGHSISNTRTYVSWKAMLNRCTNPNGQDWKRYGARGIAVCERWRTFENFFADMGERPPDRTLDRYPNPCGNYEPGNCRWATTFEQRHNRRQDA